MCSDPITKDDLTFACRRCDECIATRRHGWVARAMAEKTGHRHTLVLALTYDDSTQDNRDAAAMFCYADVRAFIKRLASACRYIDETAIVRFICAGEQGDRNGRCHWHLIIYSTLDLTSVGEFKIRGHVVSDRSQMITVGKRKRRLNWSLWGKGFVTLQEPDQGGMNYVLSYCLKDQFTGESSRGTMREAKAENFATGLFRMSKRPAIGEAFLMRKLEALLETGSVLPSLQIMIPGFHGFYHPNGSFREKLLWGLVALNQRIVWSTGGPAPQWTSLLASCQDNLSDMEILLGKENEIEEFGSFAAARHANPFTKLPAPKGCPAECRADLACDGCLTKLSDVALAHVGITIDRDGPLYSLKASQGFASIRERQKIIAGTINPYCTRSGTKQARHFFRPAFADSEDA